MGHKFLKKSVALRGLTISLDDVRRIFERLSKHLQEEADRQINDLIKPHGQSEEDFKKEIETIRKKAFRITVTIGGADGQDLFGDSLELFSSPNIPDDVAYIYMTNAVAYRGHTGRQPPNGFSVNLDFSKPPLVDNTNPVSNPTPNNSNITIEGDRDAWVASIYEATMGVLAKRRNGRNILHMAFLYDIGLMLLALPFGLYLCWRLSGVIAANIGSISEFLSGATYVYLTFAALWLYRLLFGYTKWAFPTVELREAERRSQSHRQFWYIIVTGLLSSIILEVWKATM